MMATLFFGLLVLFAAITIAILNYMYQNIFVQAFFDIEIPFVETRQHKHKEACEITAPDGTLLQADFLWNAEDDPVAILCHGYSGKKEDMNVFANFFLDHKLACLSPNARYNSRYDFGHTYEDVSSWVTFLSSRKNHKKILLFGISMGGFTVLNYALNAIDSSRVSAVVVDSPFTDLYDVIAHNLKRLYGVPRFPIMPLFNIFTRARAGFWLSEVSVKNMDTYSTRTLICHSIDDLIVPVEMSLELHKNLMSSSELYLYRGSHGSGIRTLEYRNRLSEFLKQLMMITTG